MITKSLVLFFLVEVTFAQVSVDSKPQNNRNISIAVSGFLQNNISVKIPPNLNNASIDEIQSTELPEVNTETEFTTPSNDITTSTIDFSNTIIILEETSETTTEFPETVNEGNYSKTLRTGVEEAIHEDIQNNPLIKATKKLEEHQEIADPKEEFLHFVQTALRSISKRKEDTVNDVQSVPALIKKLISSTPKLKYRPTHDKTYEESSTVEKIPEAVKYASDRTDNKKYFYHDSKVQGDLHRNPYQSQKPTFHTQPNRISSRRKIPIFSDQKLNLAKSNIQPDKEEYNIEFGDKFNDNLQEIVGQYDGRPSPKYQHQTQPMQEPKTRHMNFYLHDYRRMPTHNEQGYRSHHQRPSQTSVTTQNQEQWYTSQQPFNNPTPTQKHVIHFSTPKNRMPEDDYDAVESKRQAERAKYSFASDIEDNINGNSHHRQETRDGSRVTGAYTYEDGFFRRTVHYVADEGGYRVIKEEVAQIGNGPSYNPDGSAKFHANIAGTNVNYQITNKDIPRVHQVQYHQPTPYVQNRHDWRY